jgi:hypothetical protein
MTRFNVSFRGRLVAKDVEADRLTAVIRVMVERHGAPVEVDVARLSAALRHGEPRHAAQVTAACWADQL